jgi:transposase
VHERLRASYSETGRPSIDPEVLLRIVLIGYLYGISSERKLVEELRTHLAWRWFTGLGSIKRSHITPRFRKAAMDGFKCRNCSRSCSNRS